MPADTAVSEDNLFIPLIDLSRYLHGTPAEQAEVGQQVADGFKNAGFIYLKNHGIQQEDVDRIFAQSAGFFKRPIEQKNELAWYSAAANKGYTCTGREKTTAITDKSAVDALRAAAPDLKESMEIGRDDEPEMPNMWPSHLDAEGIAFKETMSTFFLTLKSLHTTVMRCIALGLGLDHHFFDDFTKDGDNTLRLLHYPATPKSVFQDNPQQVRAGKHTDYGSITLLFQDAVGGLQVRSPRGTWVDARPIEGTIVVNAGDLLARWSNGRIRSTEHQVVKVEGDGDIVNARYSCVYFCNPDFRTTIEALPGTYASEEEKLWPAINSGKYLEERLEQTYE